MNVVKAMLSESGSSVEITFDDGKVISTKYPITQEALSGRLTDYITVFETWLESNTPEDYDNYDGLTLEEAKIKRIKEVDSKTETLIESGFTYDDNNFSMSTNAQRNWSALGAANANSLLTDKFPLTISTVDEGSYTVTDETVLMNFFGTYLNYQTDPSQPLGSGRAIKAEINACTTVNEVKAVQDNR